MEELRGGCCTSGEPGYWGTPGWQKGKHTQENKKIIYTALQSHRPSLPSCPFIHRDLQSANLVLACFYTPRKHKNKSKLNPITCFTGHIHQLLRMRGLQMCRHYANFLAGFFNHPKGILCTCIVFLVFFLPFDYSPRTLLNNEFCTFPPQR